MGRIDRWQTIPADSQSTFRGEGRWSTTSSRMTIDCNFDDDTELSIWEKGDSNRAPRTTKWVCLTDVTLSLSFSHSLATLTNVSQGTHTPHPTTTSWSIRERACGEALLHVGRSWKDDHGSAGELRYGPMWFSMQIELFACHYANKSNDASRMYRVMQLL